MRKILYACIIKPMPLPQDNHTLRSHLLCIYARLLTCNVIMPEKTLFRMPTSLSMNELIIKY